MGRLTLVWMVGASVASTACGGGEEGKTGGGIEKGGSGGSSGGGSGGTGIILGGTGGSGKGGTSGSSTGGGPACPCENTLDGCVVLTVTRGSDTTNQPWVLWPDEADGRGSLIVAAYPQAGSSTTVWQTIDDTDFTSSDASYTVDLGCVRGGTNFLGAYLDDDMDAASGAVFSSDYLDSCPMERQPIVQVPVGATLEYEFVLTNSCD